MHPQLRPAQRGSRATANKATPPRTQVIMDGNSRWAKTRGMDISRGHEAGVGALKRTISACSDWGIPGLTTYAFSRENWLREAREVDFLLALFSRWVAAAAALAGSASKGAAWPRGWAAVRPAG